MRQTASDLQHHESNAELIISATYLRLGVGLKEVPWLLWMSLRSLWYVNQPWFLKTALAPAGTSHNLSWLTSQCIYNLWTLTGHVDQQSGRL